MALSGIQTELKPEIKRVAEILDWTRLEKLRAPQSLSKALQHLGVLRLNLVRKELRTDGERQWIPIPIWLKETYPFVERLEKNEIGAEILSNAREGLIDETYRLQETVFKTNPLGLTEVAVPLVLRGDKIGFIAMDGFVLETESVGDVALEERFKVLMFSAEEKPKALEEYRSLPHFSPDKRVIVVQMLELMAREILQFFEESLSAKDREEQVHKQTFNQMATLHQPLRATLKKLPQLAAGDAPILIMGEPGTGRELLAKLIHESSLRSKGLLRALHCSTIAENLLEAELLGYEKGAFIGAYATKAGLFELCNGGSLFLNEIGDLSLSMQHKILRILQDKTFSRLGSSETLKFDVRIIASTQRNLKKLVQVGAFREELYFRLNVLEIEMPPLRQRKEDIPLLAEHFLKTFMTVMNKEGIQWKEESLLKLSHHSFPGNVRELRNEVERLVALKDSHSFIVVEDLSSKIVESLTPIEEIEKGMTLKNIVDGYEKQIVSEALAKYHWNKSRVAELFQITRQGLLKKIAKYHLDKRKKF
ncbi:MAG: Two-component system response regulator [Bacteriovoracaceae bacterium]|nr:Two-component system response regulator [Bacteriovoracaceae bacterium]